MFKKLFAFCLSFLLMLSCFACTATQAEEPPLPEESFVEWKEIQKAMWEHYYIATYTLHYWGENVKYGDYVDPPGVTSGNFSADDFSVEILRAETHGELVFEEGRIVGGVNIKDGVDIAKCPRDQFLKGMGIVFTINYYNATSVTVRILFHDIELFTGTVYRDQAEHNAAYNLTSES